MMRVILTLPFLLHVTVATAPTYDEYPPRSLEPAADPRSWSIAEVQAWVESIGFFEYKESFFEGQVDGKRLLTMSASSLSADLLLPSDEHASLLEMEILELRARWGLMSKKELSAHREAYPLAEEWDAAGVAGFLQDSGLGKYASRFAAARIDGRKLLQLSTEQVLSLTAVEPNAHEQNQAAAEQIDALIGHLRWRSSPKAKDEL